MDSDYLKLDQEFDKFLAEMKPHVLKLPHKTDRQKCAVWIKKLCEPVSGISGRRNRNLYGQLMLHMLKRGVLEGPFTSKPQEGPLPNLPTYMTVYLEDSAAGRLPKSAETGSVPDWVTGELTTSVGSSLFKSTIGNPAAHSTWRTAGSPSHSPTRRRPHTSLGIDLEKEPTDVSPLKEYQKPSDPGQYSFATTDWSQMTAPSVSNPYLRDEGISDKGHDREIEMKTKILEAKFHEEKLRLQQKHDAAVQKILDRKNAEIEDVKAQWKSKTKETEDAISKLEKKIHTIMKESQHVQDTKDKQIQELKKMVEETSSAKKFEFEKKINDIVGEFEQEKFEMQKEHTKNIQEILDDTNARLQKMEKEYSQQTIATGNVIKELEGRVQQLMTETDTMKKNRAMLEREKMDAESRVERLQSELRTQQDKALVMEQDHQRALESHDQDLRALQRKTESNIEMLKQENNMAQAKAAETISELEQHVDQLRRSLKDAEEQRQRQIREMEQHHQQDKFHLENLHEKQLNSVKKEIDQLDQDMQKKVKKLETIVREREDEIKRLSDKNRQQAEASEKALADFKSQVEKNQTRMFDDMKQQMARVEADLNKSKQVREKQSKEFSKQMEDERHRHEREIVDLKMSFEQEKAQMLKDFHVQKEFIHGEQEKECETLKASHRQDVADLERRMHSKQEKDAKRITALEHREQELREEVVQANQLRKQQLVELGLLREEEKQKMQREHEAELSQVRSEMEQQRLELQKTHSTEMESVLGKTNDRLKQIEREYNERAEKSNETINEMQATINQLREDIKRQRETSDTRYKELVNKHDEEKKTIKKHYSSNLTTVQKELDEKYSKVRALERQLDQQQADHDEKITHLKLGYEEKVRGLMPAAVRQELESTIEALRSQVSSLQQKCSLLQEELELSNKFPVGTFNSQNLAPIATS